MKRPAMLLFLGVCQLSHAIASISMAWSIVYNPDRAKRIIVGYDRTANAVFNGSDKETISSRAGKGALQGKRGWCILCRILDYLDENHCIKSIGI